LKNGETYNTIHVRDIDDFNYSSDFAFVQNILGGNMKKLIIPFIWTMLMISAVSAIDISGVWAGPYSSQVQQMHQAAEWGARGTWESTMWGPSGTLVMNIRQQGEKISGTALILGNTDCNEVEFQLDGLFDGEFIAWKTNHHYCIPGLITASGVISNDKKSMKGDYTAMNFGEISDSGTWEISFVGDDDDAMEEAIEEADDITGGAIDVPPTGAKVPGIPMIVWIVLGLTIITLAILQWKKRKSR
jgi:hypothetical protein